MKSVTSKFIVLYQVFSNTCLKRLCKY